MMMKLKVGDVIVGTTDGNMGVVRQITEVRDTGYTWIYPEVPDKDFWSENSTDPFFGYFWLILDDESRPHLQHFIDRKNEQGKELVGVDDLDEQRVILHRHRAENRKYCKEWHDENTPMGVVWAWMCRAGAMAKKKCVWCNSHHAHDEGHRCHECGSSNLVIGGFDEDTMTPQGYMAVAYEWWCCNDCGFRWDDNTDWNDV